MSVPTIAEWDWLVTGTGGFLHHPRSTNDGDAIDDGEMAWVVLSCGRTRRACIPGFITRLGAPRCALCCKAVGYPLGKGSPKNDPACRPLVEARVQQYDIEEAEG